MMRDNVKVILPLLILLCIFVSATILLMYLNTQQQLQYSHYQLTDAYVLHYESIYDSERKQKNYLATVQYAVHDTRYVSEIKISDHTFTDTIPIYYDSSNPQIAISQIPDETTVIQTFIVFDIMILSLICVHSILLLYDYKQKRTE